MCRAIDWQQQDVLSHRMIDIYCRLLPIGHVDLLRPHVLDDRMVMSFDYFSMLSLLLP